MNSKELIEDLHARGLIAQLTDAMIEHLEQAPRTIYCGFDPTAGSLHIGHLVPLLMLKRFASAGHQVVALVGGATGMIGDPSFKATERTLNSHETVTQWALDLANQIKTVLKDEVDQGLVRVVNNADWMSPMNVLTFLRDVGKHFSVNAMINKESVKQRLARPDQGISFTEFSYALLQSYDFAELNRQHQCSVQLGGSDQWGNITCGIDLTRRLNQQTVYGMTVPLITKADGTKFGKTESGAVWLDAAKTSPYAFYQFWLNTADDDVYRFLRFYTFLSLAEIVEIEQADLQRNKPEAQRILARLMTALIHGQAAVDSAERIANALFTGYVFQLSRHELAQLAQDGLPCSTLPRPTSLVELLVKTGLATSNRIAREHIEQGAISVNGDTVTHDSLNDIFLLHDQYLLLKRGKKNFHLVQCF